jgi:hypothetical protein
MNVSEFEIGEIGQDLVLADALGKHFQDVRDPDAQAANTRLPTALAGIKGDAVFKTVVHGSVTPA